MLDEIGPWLASDKAKDLLNRLENVAPNQSIPAEYELALSWAVSKVASLEIDKPVAKRRPDIYSSDLLLSGPLIADVAAVDDVSLSGIATMRRARNIINSTCDRIRRKSSRHLHYTFAEKSGYIRSPEGKSKFHRHRLVSRGFQMDEGFRAELTRWLGNGRPEQPLVWKSEDIDVSIRWTEFVHPFANIFCTMPSLACDPQDNPLYRVLEAKSKQLRDVPVGHSRAIFLGNAGCSLLNNIQPMGLGVNAFSGKQIIEGFLADDPSIDFVVVFSVERIDRFSVGTSDNRRVWRSYIFHRGRPMPTEDMVRLKLLTERLPAPYLSGYEAHAWHEQGMCRPDSRGRYIGTDMSIGREKMILRISARAVQELIAGTLSYQIFQHTIFGEHNPVREQLAEGRTIADVRFESKAVDEDDDCLVFEFRLDPAATPLRLPVQLKTTD